MFFPKGIGDITGNWQIHNERRCCSTSCIPWGRLCQRILEIIKLYVGLERKRKKSVGNIKVPFKLFFLI